MYHAIPETMRRHGLLDDKDISATLEFINRYVYANVHPYGKVRDDGAGWMLIYGEAWCDSVANIFLQLIASLDVRGYLVFLKLPSGASPHSVAYCTPGDMSIRDVEYLHEKAVVIDPQNGIIYRTENNRFSSPSQICGGLAYVPSHLLAHKEYYCEASELRSHNQPISVQSRFKKWFYINIFPHVPEDWMMFYIKAALVLDDRLETAERMYCSARVEQLFFNYAAAVEGYREVLVRYPETRWSVLASYWRGQILSGSLFKCFRS